MDVLTGKVVDVPPDKSDGLLVALTDCLSSDWLVLLFMLVV